MKFYNFVFPVDLFESVHVEVPSSNLLTTQVERNVQHLKMFIFFQSFNSIKQIGINFCVVRESLYPKRFIQNIVRDDKMIGVRFII